VKGISHFATGLAIATFFPQVVQQAALGSILPVLGGVAGLLPDTLDFRFARFAERYHTRIAPAADADAGGIARQLAAAARRAYEGQPQNVLLQTVPLGGSEWLSYAVRFDVASNRVKTRMGPIVSTGGTPLPGSRPQPTAEAQVRLDVPLAEAHEDEISVDCFQGPSLRFEREGDGVRVLFLNWHRRWSHSLLLALALGLATAGAAKLAETASGSDPTGTPLWAGIVAALGFAAHILEDQLGHMGTNLLAPLTKQRTPGLRLLHSGDAIPNTLAVWTAVVLVLFNLDRFSAAPRLDPLSFLGVMLVLPLAVLGTVYSVRRRRTHRDPLSTQSQRRDGVLAEIGRNEDG
jgi:membrane-bound metal-dependent hydrolase YbcI (DUF457 family)